jgi:hypothetical protein
MEVLYKDVEDLINYSQDLDNLFWLYCIFKKLIV